MARLVWDDIGEKIYETGTDHGVLYQIDATAGTYVDGVAWNGLTGVTESPSGAEATPQYADNIKYLNIISAEEFGGTIEAFTYPDEFGQNDGSLEIQPGVFIGQQNRRPFGFSYRTMMGNDTEGQTYGYKIHLVYNATVTPSEKAYATINDSPEPITFSWEFTTTPVPVSSVPTAKPTASLVVESVSVDPTKLSEFETILYGSGDASTGIAPRMPLPDEVYTLFGA